MEAQSVKVRVIQAANGQATAIASREDGREFYLHSRINPGQEAEFLVSDIPIKPNCLYLILGCGLGYHVGELLKKISRNSRVVILESARASFVASLRQDGRRLDTKWLKDPRLIFQTFKEPDSICISLADLIIKHRLFSMKVFTHIPSAMMDQAFYKKAVAVIPRYFEACLSYAINTVESVLETKVTNYWKNIQTLWQNPSVEGLKNGWAGCPAIIVAAGPSLNDQIETLRHVKGKALIICMGPAARVLIEQGIYPDFIITIDPFKENMRHFQGLETRHSSLLYYHKVWREVPASYEGAKFWFAMQRDLQVPLIDALPDNPFFEGGSVAFSALQFAQYVQAEPIIFVGQDFAFHKGLTHAQGTIHNVAFDEAELPEGYFYVPGTMDNTVVTDHFYYSYLVYIQEVIQNTPGFTYINTSSTGAKIQGTEWMTLENALERFCTKQIDTKSIIQLAQRSGRHVGKDKIISQLNKWREELRCFLQESGALNNPKQFMAGFKSLNVMKYNQADYEDFLHVMELRAQYDQNQHSESTLERLKDHIICISEAIEDIRAGLGHS